MTVTGSMQAVVMAGGKGSRMTELTSGKAKCLLPVGNYPLVWYPVNMLQAAGFTDAIVVVPDSARQEVARIPSTYGLNIKLDIFGIPGHQELGTADSLRLISDKITGTDILIVSGDLMLEESLRGVVDLHRMNNSSFTALLSKPMFDVKSAVVPGSKSTKHKKERDLIGLSGDRVCLFTAEADVEEEVKISDRIIRAMGRIHIHSDILDTHLYIMKKWVCDYVLYDKNISTIKGELLPILVKKQFSRQVPDNQIEDNASIKKTILDFLPKSHHVDRLQSKFSYGCHAFLSGPCLRVNTLPAYWEANRRARGSQVHNQAKVGERAQITDCMVGQGCSISDKTTLTNVSLSSGCRIEEKVRISNCVLMENVTVKSGSNIEDSIICDNCTVSAKSSLKLSILGRGQQTAEGADIVSQLVMDKDRMMEV